ncbi:hypothetical protein OXX69_004976 [Metschnikowia pulcherrima]
MAMSRDKFTLYWLNDSRSHRIMWILEILQLDYEIEIFLRDPDTWRAPPELFHVHPLGKSPVLDINFADGRPGVQLAESGLIVQYLLKHYDPKSVLDPGKESDRLEVDYYIHYTEGTLQPILMSMLINTTVKRIAPFGLKTMAKLVSKGLNYGYYIHEFDLNLAYLEKKLLRQGTGFFVGNKLSGADIMLSFPIYENLFDNEAGVRECSGETQLHKKYPQLGAWCDKVKNDPIYSRISEVMAQKVEELRRSTGKQKV